MPLLIGTTILLMIHPPTRRRLFPSAPLALHNTSSGELQTPQAGYLGSVGIRPVVGGMGISIMTTPRGVMTGRAARKQHIGGEVLCEVW